MTIGRITVFRFIGALTLFLIGFPIAVVAAAFGIVAFILERLSSGLRRLFMLICGLND